MNRRQAKKRRMFCGLSERDYKKTWAYRLRLKARSKRKIQIITGTISVYKCAFWEMFREGQTK